jgi:hypothetical protein
MWNELLDLAGKFYLCFLYGPHSQQLFFVIEKQCVYCEVEPERLHYLDYFYSSDFPALPML